MKCVLKKGKEKPLRNRHPWIFSGAIDQIEESVQPGDIIRVFSFENEYLGTGYVNPRSQLTVRILSFEDVPIDKAFFTQKIRAAFRLREMLGFPSAETNAYRVIHAEGDYLPGLIVDRYGDFLAAQFLTEGMNRQKSLITEILHDIFRPKAIFEKDDTESREKEGLSRETGVLAGTEIPDEIPILENGHRFSVDLKGGQKTGFFLDQRDNRLLVQRYSRSRQVLNCFAYTGAFSVYAAAGGADSVVSVESSQAALDLTRKHFDLNDLTGSHSFVREDVFRFLRQMPVDYDFIILDPPAFCKHKAQVDQACRGYKDINLQALRRLRPNSLLFTASCSSFISADLFQKVLFAAAKDAGRYVRILSKTSHAQDHPINIFHPEGEYLKGILCEVL